MIEKDDVAIYTLSKDSLPFFFEMHVVRDNAELEKYVKDFYRGVYKREDVWEEGTRALVRRTGYSGDAPFAYLFVSEDALGTRVLSHECTHLALAYSRAAGRKLPTAEAGIDDAEEDLCYLIGDMMAGVVEVLRENGHYNE